ncbi:cleavage stimulating factor 64 [Rhodamnia argentea]|uniref:Cleavage stimulating factor 64 n=1 Tax=Rhodamnia argentea TaxID=178133 RepID=A0A8B8MRH6_9MYRT|nr:cleavage stimulating factor 64 [Rhodamnia argentea]
MASSQHRCVFVGNIPYDATEEQLKEICQEVGPVVSFRLVIDRETGKPKGYGFCEYKDEETALSARRNLQGYEINGRQLRVDFAENDKGSDRNREQGRGGPGLSSSTDPARQVGGPAIHGESVNQPIGLHIAITAAAAMAGALGGAQVSMLPNQNGLQSQSALTNDPLTLQLAKMSRSQLNEVISELKAMATRSKESARQLLLSNPQLCKALFQAEIMLGLVTPQMLHMQSIRQGPTQPSEPAARDGHMIQQQAIQTLSGLPPLGQRVQQPGLMPKLQHGQVSSVPQGSHAQNQISGLSQLVMQPQIQFPQVNYPQGMFTGPSGASTSLPITTRGPVPNAASVTQQMHSFSSQQPRMVGAADLAHNLQPGPSISSGISGRIGGELSEPSNHPSKLMRVEDVRASSFSLGGPNNAGGLGAPPFGPVSLNPAPQMELQHPERQASQVSSNAESVLLQQVMSLTAEQLSSLPPEQREQVLQLQQMLRRDQNQAT